MPDDVKQMTVGFVSVEAFCKDFVSSHEVWARKYLAVVEGVEQSAVFVLCIPKNFVLGRGMIRSIAGDMVASLLEASRVE